MACACHSLIVLFGFDDWCLSSLMPCLHFAYVHKPSFNQPPVLLIDSLIHWFILCYPVRSPKTGHSNSKRGWIHHSFTFSCCCNPHRLDLASMSWHQGLVICGCCIHSLQLTLRPWKYAKIAPKIPKFIFQPSIFRCYVMLVSGRATGRWLSGLLPVDVGDQSFWVVSKSLVALEMPPALTSSSRKAPFKTCVVSVTWNIGKKRGKTGWFHSKLVFFSNEELL